jgi:hypothetical protein
MGARLTSDNVSATPDLHPGCVPLMFLLGTWRGEGVGGYPGMTPFRYGEEITFSHAGKPWLAYSQRTWHLDEDDRPLHFETGFWRPQPDGSLEVVNVQATGFVEIYYGTVTGTKIELATDLLGRTASAKEVTAITRLFGLVEGKLMYALDMAAMGHPMQSHLSAVLERAPAAR